MNRTEQITIAINIDERQKLLELGVVLGSLMVQKTVRLIIERAYEELCVQKN